MNEKIAHLLLFSLVLRCVVEIQKSSQLNHFDPWILLGSENKTQNVKAGEKISTPLVKDAMQYVAWKETARPSLTSQSAAEKTLLSPNVGP